MMLSSSRAWASAATYSFEYPIIVVVFLYMCGKAPKTLATYQVPISLSSQSVSPNSPGSTNVFDLWYSNLIVYCIPSLIETYKWKEVSYST